jgi:hypothetical protein
VASDSAAVCGFDEALYIASIALLCVVSTALVVPLSVALMTAQCIAFDDNTVRTFDSTVWL